MNVRSRLSKVALMLALVVGAFAGLGLYTFSYDVLAVVNALRAALPPKSLTDF